VISTIESKAHSSKAEGRIAEQDEPRFGQPPEYDEGSW
jgi:hypothetical protein